MKRIPELPGGVEGFMFGMNTLEDPCNLKSGMYQLLQNAFPGVTIEPRNGINEVMESSALLGVYGELPEDSFFRPERCFIQAGGKDFVFVWNQARTTTDYFALEIWNITDDARTQLIVGDYNQTDVHFSMVKLYDAVYITMDYEMQNNPNSSYRTKNKIVEWDSDNSTWLVREMGIDVAGQFGTFEAVDLEGVEYGELSGHSIVFVGDRYICLGGTNGDGDENVRVYESFDADNWQYITDLPFTHTIGMSVIVADLGSGLRIVCMGGTTTGGAESSAVYTSSATSGWVTWTKIGDLPQVRAHHSSAFFDEKLWVIGGADSNGAETSNVYNSSDGITWTEKTQLPHNSVRHTSLVYNDKLWVIGGHDTGVGNWDEVYSTTDGSSWTTETGTAAFGERYDHSSIVYQNRMWVFWGRGSGGTAYTNSYYSSDGITWTIANSDIVSGLERGGATVYERVEDNIVVLTGGDDSGTYYNDAYESDDGVTFLTSGGLTDQKYYSYACTFVRRTDSYAKLATFSDYEGGRWYTHNGQTIVGIDEKLMPGTVTATVGGTITGVDTTFEDDLEVGDYVRFGGSDFYSVIESITNNLSMVVDNTWGHDAGTKYSLLPVAEDPIATSTYHPGIIEGIENLDNRRVVFANAVTGDKVQVYITLPPDSVIDDAVAQGATHIRIYRTLGDANKIIAQGLSHRFLVDIPITGDTYSNDDRIYVDTTSDNALEGESNILEMVGFSVPPLGRYCIWSGNVLWIGGVPGEKGKWFHSVVAGTAGVSFDTQFPQKYASMYDLDEDYLTCDPSDGLHDTGGASLAGDLFLFKERKVFQVFNSDPDNKPVLISSTIGCAFPFTICNAEIPILGGHVILFLSESGPAYISAGGNVKLLPEFAIAEFYRKNVGIIRNLDGSSTSWYTRNKVTSEFWDNTWWVFFGDSDDSLCELFENKCFGFRFSESGNGIGPFENIFPTPVSLVTVSHRDNDDQGGEGYDVAVDVTNKIIMLANKDRGLDSYTYDSDGLLNHVENIDRGDAYGVALDTTNRLVFLAKYSGGIETYSYDLSGNITYVESDFQGGEAFGVAVDTVNRLLFLANGSGGIATYTYSTGGSLTRADSSVDGEIAYYVAVDTTNQLIFVPNFTTGLITYSYDTSGNLTPVDSDDQGGQAFGVAVDSSDMVVFLANGSRGIETYSYDENGNLTHVDNDDQGGEARGVAVDTTNKIVALGNNTSGLEVYGYSAGVLTHRDNDDQGGEARGTICDTTNNFIFLANGTNGLETYYYITSIYEPQSLISVNNNIAYTLSHKDHYGLAQFLKPGLFRDTFLTAGAISYYMAYQTRYLYVGLRRTDRGIVDAVIVHIRFLGTGGNGDLTLTLNLDKSRLTAVCDWEQSRQSGMSNAGMADYRNFIHVLVPESVKIPVSFFDVKVEKLVPSDGGVSMSGTELVLHEGVTVEPEFSDSFSNPTGSNTFVVQADSSPEENAHA